MIMRPGSKSDLSELVIASQYIAVGVDLGQNEDYTAIAVISSRSDPGTPQIFEITGLKRFPVGTPYPAIVESLRHLLRRAELRGSDLVIDATGVGRPVVDYLAASGLSPVAVTIHGGDSVSSTRGKYLEFRVPKRDLIANLQVLVQNKLLRVNPRIQLAKILASELQNLRVKIDPRTAHDSYGAWREGEHDDLVLATAIAVWYIRYSRRQNIRTDDFTSEYWKLRYFLAGV